MEYSQINALTKFGADDYGLWQLTMPREKLHEIRQDRPIVDGDMHRVFAELRTVQQPEGGISFVLPHGDGLRLYTADMGGDFVQRNRCNGTSIRGSREEIMAGLRENLKAQGYSLRPNAWFQNVDVPATLRKIMELNTDFYQTDFRYDVEKLREAAEDRGGYRNFFWLTRKSGTWSFPERDVYIRNTNDHNTWSYYGADKSEHVKAFWIELKRMDDDKNIIGDIVEMDYQKHLDYLCTHSLDPAAVEIVFKSPNDVRIFSYQEYNQNWQSIAQRYGTMERKKFLVENQLELARTVISAHGLIWDAAEPTSIDSYVKRLEHDRLHDYGYTADDVQRIGPTDAEKAVKHGLCCYALHDDGTKESIADREVFQQHLFHSKLFGMTAAENQILQYFKQEAPPLFSGEEMRAICSLALQAGMGNDPSHTGVLDSIIHKAECCLPSENTATAQEQEQECDREE